MNPIALLLLGAAGVYLYASGALDGLLPSRNLPTRSLMDPPKAPTPTAPTSGTSGFGGTAGVIGAIGAAVGGLVYGIVEKGWFRGGEEGVKVNPARDDFFTQFVNYARSQGAQIDYSWQQPSLVYAFGRFAPHLDGNQVNALITALYEADTMERYMSAAKAIAAPLAAGGFPNLQIPV